jgi:hypothetical protein
MGRHPPLEWVVADEQRRAAQSILQEERQQWKTLDQKINTYCNLVELILAGFLIVRGFRRHRRESYWRKRRGYTPITASHIVEEKMMIKHTDNTSKDDVHKNLQQLVPRGESNDDAAIRALQPVVHDLAIYNHATDMGKEVKSRLTHYMASGNPKVQEELLAEMDARKVALLEAMAPATPFEGHLFDLLAEEMEICRVQSRHADTIDARHSAQEAQQKRQDRAHKRYQNALRTTAQVYKALKGKPAVQVNLAQNQINVA